MTTDAVNNSNPPANADDSDTHTSSTTSLEKNAENEVGCIMADSYESLDLSSTTFRSKAFGHVTEGTLGSLDGKRILVAGCTSELERAIIKTLLDQGVEVTTIDHITHAGALCGSIDVDIKTVGNIDEIVSLLKNSGVRFNGMVFAKTVSDFRPICMNTPQKVYEIMDRNFFFFMELMRLLVKKRMLSEGSSVVAMSSISSIHAMKAKASFAAAKAALDSAVRCLASELAEKGIRVNSIQKGGVDADMTKSHIKAISELNHGDEAKRQPLGLVKAKEIGNLVTFLLSDACPSITGTSIVIDGGYLL